MSKTCWYCNQVNEQIPDDFVGDFNCVSCGVENDCLDGSMPDLKPENQTTESEWLNKEEEKMKPPSKDKTDFEKVAIGEMLPGVIEDISYDQEHKFKGYQGGPDTIQPAVRFKFVLDGYKFAHYSRWYKFNYGEKANLYKIFLIKLVENAEPNIDFDLDLLKGMKVKTLWNENGDFQNLESIYPIDAKAKASDLVPQTAPEIFEEDPENVNEAQ